VEDHDSSDEYSWAPDQECPRCVQTPLMPIVWGLPSDPGATGVIFGGCSVPAEPKTHQCPHCHLQVWRDQYKIQEYTNLEELLQRMRCKDLEQLNDRIEDFTDGLVMLYDHPEQMPADIGLTNGTRGTGFTFPITNMDFMTEIEFLEDNASEFWRDWDEE